MWFFAGGDVFEDPVLEIFCECHAQQMGASMMGLKRCAVNKMIGMTVLEQTTSESLDLELPSYVNEMATESLTNDPPMVSQIVSKLAKEKPRRIRNDSPKTTKPSKGNSAASMAFSEKRTEESPVPIEESIAG